MVEQVDGDAFVAGLREIAKRDGQVNMARNSGVSQSTVCRILQGKRLGNMKTVIMLVQAYPELGRFLLPENMLN